MAKERKQPAKKKDDADEDIWLTLRLPPPVHAEAKRLSEADDRSLNKWLVRAVEAFAESEAARLGKAEKKAAAR